MTFIARKTRLLVPRWLDEGDPGYLYRVHRKRSDGRLKRHSSCDDSRAWVDNKYLNYQHLLDLMCDREDTPMLRIMGRFIPIEDIIELFCKDVCLSNSSSSKLRTRTRSRSKQTLTNDMLRVIGEAVMKLENINKILITSSNHEAGKRSSNEGSGNQTDPSYTAESCSSNNISANEEYAREYNKLQQKIEFLISRLDHIQQRRKELEKKMGSLKCKCKNQQSITELYNRTEELGERRFQKLVAERGKVLNEMCHTLKQLDELNEKYASGTALKEIGKSSTDRCRDAVPKKAVLRNCSAENNKKKASETRVGFYNLPFISCFKWGRSSEGTMSSQSSTLRRNASQTTYNICAADEYVDNFESVTMTEVELALRSYEQRLRDFETLEESIETLKRNAELTDYFKRRWLRCTTRGRSLKIAEKERMMQEVGKLCAENSDLKKTIQKLEVKSEKENSELEMLRFKQRQVSQMENEIAEMKHELNNYHVTYENHRGCMEKLQGVVRRQKKEIENLMEHIARINEASERFKDECRQGKKCSPRSRSHGPEVKQQRRMPKSEDEMSRTHCCKCCYLNYSIDIRGRPKSECTTRKMSNGRSCERQNVQDVMRQPYKN